MEISLLFLCALVGVAANATGRGTLSEWKPTQSILITERIYGGCDVISLVQGSHIGLRDIDLQL